MTASLTSNRPLAEQIIESHLTESGTVRPGQIVSVRADRVYVQDGNAPTVAKLYDQYGFTTVKNPSQVAFVFDHSVLVANTDMADRMAEAHRFGVNLGIEIVKRGAGISHVVAAEAGWFAPGSLVLGSDSHTCVGGASGSLGLGMGASDIVHAMVSGTTWLRVPETITVMMQGVPHPAVAARDVILALLRQFGQSPFLYKSIEFGGRWIENLEPDEAASFASLGVELGAKCVFLAQPASGVPAGKAFGSKTLNFDISGVEPVVSAPHLPANTGPLLDYAGLKIDYAFLGTCTSGRLNDLREAARVLVGNVIHRDVNFVVTPGSREVYENAISEGYIQALVAAGALVTPPGCGACVGTQGPLPARGDRVLSTMNRNFKGRMGTPEAEIFLASPRVVASAAVQGSIPTLEELL